MNKTLTAVSAAAAAIAFAGCAATQSQMKGDINISASYKTHILDDVRSEAPRAMLMEVKDFDNTLDALFVNYERTKSRLNAKQHDYLSRRSGRGGTPDVMMADVLQKYRSR